MLTRDQTYRFCSAPCGSGKTHNIIRRACDIIKSGGKVVIAQPTKDLIEKTVREELTSRPKCPDYKIFHGDRVPAGSSVAKELVTYLKCDPAPLVFITHQVLHCMPYWHSQEDWDLIIDEELQVYRCSSHQVPETHQLLTDHLRVEPTGPIYGRVSMHDLPGIERKAKNTGKDQLLAQISETLLVLLNEHHETFVDLEHYAKLLTGQSPRLTFYSLLQPSVVKGFCSVFMTAANFADTAVYHLWSAAGIKFIEDGAFGNGLRYGSHPNGGSTTIYYCLEAPWSRKCCDKIVDETTKCTTLNRMTAAVDKLFGTEPFVWQTNRRFAASPFGSHATRLPHKPHGINNYANVHNVAFLSSLNPSSDQFRFLESKGLSSQEVRTITYYSTAYQAVMRTSLRNPHDFTPKRIVVPDRDAAEYLHKLLPGSRVERLDVGLPSDHCCPKQGGRPRKHPSDRDRVAAHRQKQKEKKQQMMKDLGKLSAQYATGEEGIEGEPGCCNETGYNLITHFVTGRPLAGTIYFDKRAIIPHWYLVCPNETQFIQFLHESHSRIVSCKEEAFLISPAIFDATRSDDPGRKYEHIVYLRHLWLDFENGDLTCEQFGDLFPKIGMVTMNSYNHTPENPRFRIVILTADIMTPDVYKLLFDNVVKKLKDAGYWTQQRKETEPPGSMRRSGLDWSKRPPTSLFYLPCQAKNPEHSFFGHQPGEAIDPKQWLEHSAVEPHVEFGPRESDRPALRRPVNENKVQSAIMQWRTSTSIPGKGNDMFFQLAVDLRSAGMSLNEIEYTLKNEAKRGRSPSDRRTQIPSIMATLRRNQR